MKAVAVNLPDYFHAGKHNDFHIHHYSSSQSNVKHKIVLSQNLICVLLNGSKEIYGSHNSVRINNSEIVLLTSGSVLMWESSADNCGLESFLIFFSNRLLKEFCVKHNLDIGPKGEKTAPILALKKDEFLYNFQESLKLLEDRRYASLHQTKLEELLVYLMVSNRHRSVDAFIRNALTESHGDKLRQVVVSNGSNGLSIEELAFLCNMSVSTFNRHFLKAFNCSPKKYLTDRKMERAHELLLLDKRPSEIYFDLGYQSLSSFSTEFKKYFGMSPGKYQRKDALTNSH